MQLPNPETTSHAHRAQEPWHALSPHDVQRAFVTDPERGLTTTEASSRLAKHGGNTLGDAPEEPWWQEAAESLTEPLQLLLIAVAALYFWFGETEDAITILVVILAVAAIEVFSELRAKRAVAALSSLSAPHATVVRDGRAHDVPSRDLVVGDVVLLAAGHRVPADVRLIDSAALRIDESSLTGESAPVLKAADASVAQAAELADRHTMGFAATLVAGGKGRAIVVATGLATEVGRIAGLVRDAREPRTPLQQALRQLSKWLLWAAIGFSVLVPLLGVLLAGRPVKEMVLVGLTLAFATIPEELPILITIVLGLGAYRLSQRQAIVRRLRAAETLGSVSVVATDKTGTLTENRMRVAELKIDGAAQPAAKAAGTLSGQRLLLIGLLANDAQLSAAAGDGEPVGDPTEVALLIAAQDAGLDVASLRQRMRPLQEFPFTDDRKRMSVVLDGVGEPIVACKGSPVSVLAVCSATRHRGQQVPLDAASRETLLGLADDMASRGLRVLGFAERRVASEEGTPATAERTERELVFLGFAGLRDPPRPEARAAVEALQGAGVRVVMLTGDHPATALAIAGQVGLRDAASAVRGSDLDRLDEPGFQSAARCTAVFARITPEHKLRVVRALQAGGEVVAVTGDGVNDAPALREAAIGVTMGRGGTDVAREAADLILADDNFATVTEAVRTGRVLFANLRKAVRYYLAAKVALVSASLAAVMLKLPVPFEPVQIIVMELFMDLGASVTFVSEPPEDDVMKRPPRDPRARFMDRSMVWGIVAGGMSLSAVVLCGYLGALQLGSDVAHAQTAAFAAWMLGHVVLAANMRSERQLLVTNLLANKAFLVWAASAVLLVVLATAVPWLRGQLHMTTISASMWAIVTAAALALPSCWELWKLRLRGSHPTSVESTKSNR